MLKIICQGYNQLLNGLSQGVNYQLQKANALRNIPGFLSQQEQAPQLAYSQCLNQAANLQQQYNNQVPAANLWNVRYQNAMNKLNGLAPQGQLPRSQVYKLVQQSPYLIQAPGQVNNLIINSIPNNLNAQQAYPLHLNLCILLKIQLEGLLAQAAGLQNQLNQNNLSPQEAQNLQNQLTTCQNGINALQPQYNSQKQICIALKFITLCQGQIQNLQNQIANLLQPYSNNPGVSNLSNLQGVPLSILQNVNPLQ